MEKQLDRIETNLLGVMEMVVKMKEDLIVRQDTKFAEHDRRFDAYNKRFDAHDQRFDQLDEKLKEHDAKFAEHDRRFDAHDKRFDQLDSQIDLLAQTVVNHTDRLDRIEQNMATKADLRQIIITLDHLVVLAEKKDQELTVLAHQQRGTNDRLEVAEKDIRLMKPLLGLS
ncbi:MAG: hypothetical protein HYV42_03620 [Candidatus Magasanikbacteria bacterium]|nr:hypothetical protein [Candidatus Magasanikbacteria bacterium]